MRDSVVVRSLICNRKRSGPMIALWIQNYLGNVVLIKNIASLDKFHYLTMIDEFKIHLTKLHKRRMSLVAWDEHLFNLRWPSFVFIAHFFAHSRKIQSVYTFYYFFNTMFFNTIQVFKDMFYFLNDFSAVWWVNVAIRLEWCYDRMKLCRSMFKGLTFKKK